MMIKSQQNQSELIAFFSTLKNPFKLLEVVFKTLTVQAYEEMYLKFYFYLFKYAEGFQILY